MNAWLTSSRNPHQQINQQYLVKRGYLELLNTLGLYTHFTRPIAFTLVIKKFGIKYTKMKHGDHLLATIKEDCVVEEDWTDGLYSSIELN